LKPRLQRLPAAEVEPELLGCPPLQGDVGRASVRLLMGAARSPNFEVYSPIVLH